MVIIFPNPVKVTVVTTTFLHVTRKDISIHSNKCQLPLEHLCKTCHLFNMQLAREGDVQNLQEISIAFNGKQALIYNPSTG